MLSLIKYTISPYSFYRVHEQLSSPLCQKSVIQTFTPDIEIIKPRRGPGYRVFYYLLMIRHPPISERGTYGSRPRLLSREKKDRLKKRRNHHRSADPTARTFQLFLHEDRCSKSTGHLARSLRRNPRSRKRPHKELLSRLRSRERQSRLPSRHRRDADRPYPC